MKRKNNQQEMQDHIQRWKKSRMTKIEYCNQQSLSYHSFKYWCIKLGYKSRTRRKASPGFISLHVNEPPAIQNRINEKIEISYPNGVCIKISESTALPIIKNLISI